MKAWKKISFIAMLSLVLMAGCTPFVENNEVEDIAPVIFWSISETDEGKLEISTLVPPLVKEKKRLLTLNVDLIEEGGKEFNLLYYRELKTGQLRMVLINEELAKKGIRPILESMLTDPDISQRLFLLIFRGNFKDYIQNQLNQQENLDYFLYSMLRHYDEYNQGEMSIINLHQFMKRLYSPYSFPILPVFKADKDSLIYEGTAFFSEDKLITSIEKLDEQLFQLLSNDHYLKLFAIPDLAVTLGHVRSNVKINFDQKQSLISFKVMLDGRIEEYRGEKNILKDQGFYAFNQEIESYLEKQTTDLLNKMQELKVDPMQIGTNTLSPFSKPMSEKDWLYFWEKANFDVDFNLKIEPLTNVGQ
ncbi:Ger(x)C family spore germination protein [Cytobacillus sp. FJAT-54145]|uniref:Ger(X)C family spore germination protein n=1 Tax=Cytobacillus spartinae TaxID=3299023 RepID=A0ABW6K6H9_9BACI